MKLLTTFLVCICFMGFGYSQTDTLCTGALGDVKWSVLDPGKFQEVNGDCWTLMDGQILPADAKLKAMGFNAIPNGQGVFLRAIDMRTEGRQDSRPKGTNPGDFQEDAIESHIHHYEDIYYSENETFSDNFLPNTTIFPARDRIGSNDNDKNNEYWQINRKSENFGDVETRPKNIALYLYIRIN